MEIATGVWIDKIVLNACVKSSNSRSKVALKLLNKFYPNLESVLTTGKGLHVNDLDQDIINAIVGKWGKDYFFMLSYL